MSPAAATLSLRREAPGAGDAPATSPRATGWRWRIHRLTVAAVLLGGVVVGSLVWLTGVVATHTQQNLLDLQAHEAGVVLDQAASGFKTPLASAAGIADASGGDAAKIMAYVGPDVGTARGKLFDSLSVWRLTPRGPQRVLAAGRPAQLGPASAAFSDFLSGVPGPQSLAVRGELGARRPSLAFAVESIGNNPRYVVYAEAPLPSDRRAAQPTSSAFHELGFSLYLRRAAVGSGLIETTGPMPATGPVDRVHVPFGTATLDLVAWPTQWLGGGVLPALPWIILGVGLVLVATGAVTTEWLVRRRRMAEGLARENRRLYTEQHSIAQKLQEALLPQRLPEMTGMEIAARYISGDPVADIGGDWYDVIRCDDRSFVFVVGDVSGRGVPAANTMASLHFAIRAYAAQGDDPTTILGKLCGLLDVARDGHFATVLLGHVDVPLRRVTLANAGHLPPLVVWPEGVEYLETRNGGPIGVSADVRYAAVSVRLPAEASVLAFTDGLVERRGESIDAGLERLRLVTAGWTSECSGLLDAAASLATEGAGDDVAMLALRWTA